MSTHGVVVDHNESGVRYAVSDRNLNEKIHTYVRDLKPGETVVGFRPKTKGAIVAEAAAQDEEEEPEDYSGKEWTLAALNDEIDARNEDREAGSELVPDGTKKHDLIALLLEDDKNEDSGE